MTKSAREEAVRDLVVKYDLYSSGLDRVVFEKLDNAYGETRPLSPINGDKISWGKAASNYPQGVKSEFAFNSNRIVSLKKYRLIYFMKRNILAITLPGRPIFFISFQKPMINGAQ